MQADEVIHFWFEECTQAQWWAKDPAFDQQIKQRFGTAHSQAIACELADWRLSADGRLGEIIILDQFSRNIYRDTPKAFAQDAQALSLAQESIAHGANEDLHDHKKAFLYMPFMHSESKIIHAITEMLFSEQGMEANLEFERQHKKIIDRFGRYPHRNEILGRTSTAEEIEFLTGPNSSF